MPFDRSDYRRRVQGCWMGKNIGGTLGAPFEWVRRVNNVSFYTQDLGGEPLPNDDLDLQLLWLIAMEEQGIDINAAVLAEYWCLYITPHWSEYGTGKINLRAGLPPPWSGNWGNDFRHSCGSFIRSEIWACVAPGMPDVAVRYAVEDSIVDHGDGEGTWGEVFMAALESAAFMCKDIHKLIDIGLSYIPAESGMAKAIRCAVAAHKSGKGWRAGRDEVLTHHRGSTFFNIPEHTSPEDRAKGFDKGVLGYDAPSNVALVVLSLLEGGDDFGKVVTTATNCGEDTDCTAATAGAIFGLMHGIEAIPAKWIEPIGRKIKTACLNLGELGYFGAQIPQDVDNLTDRTEKVAEQVLARASYKRRPGKPENAEAALAALYAKEPLRQDLARRVGVVRHCFPFFTVDVSADEGPGVRPGEPKTIKIAIHNTGKIHAQLSLRWHLPEGWAIEPADCGTIHILPGALGSFREAAFTLRAGTICGPSVRCVLEIAINSRPTVMTVPIVLMDATYCQKV